MGLFSKSTQTVARAAVGAAVAATSTLGSYAKQYVSSQKVIDTARNTASIVRSSSSKKR